MVEQRLKASESLGSSSNREISDYKPRSHQKDLQKRPMPENDKTATEINNSVSIVSRTVKKMGEKP